MKKEKNNIKKIIIILFIIIATLFIWARFINTKGLKVNEYSIINKDLPKSFHGLKIVQFSDVLYGETTNLDDLNKIVKNINTLKPDIVVFTGDLFSKNITPSKKELKTIEKYLSNIDASLYKYAISGNSDKNNYNEYKKIIDNSNFILLNNSNELLYYKSNTPIKIVGLKNTKDLENTFKEENAKASFTIALMHKPDDIDLLNDYRVDIAFAGHSLGGQLKVPFLGGLIKVNGAKKYIDGYYKVGDTDFYVSSGIGTEKFKFRTFNKPSINLYRIYAK